MNHKYLVELCAGSAAVSLHVLGYGRPPVSVTGSKGGYAETISKILGLRNLSKLVLVDVGRWGTTWQVLTNNSQCHQVSEQIIKSYDKEPRVLWEALRSEFVLGGPSDNVEYAAKHLLLLSGTYAGTEKGGFRGYHKHRPNNDGFMPNRLTLAKRIEQLAKVKWPEVVEAKKVSAFDVEPFPCICYIDPPYQNSAMKYINNISIDGIVKLARRWKDAGAKVCVSESKPVENLVKDGWKTIEITQSRIGQLRRNSRTSEEWLTIS